MKRVLASLGTLFGIAVLSSVLSLGVIAGSGLCNISSRRPAALYKLPFITAKIFLQADRRATVNMKPEPGSLSGSVSTNASAAQGDSLHPHLF